MGAVLSQAHYRLNPDLISTLLWRNLCRIQICGRQMLVTNCTLLIWIQQAYKLRLHNEQVAERRKRFGSASSQTHTPNNSYTANGNWFISQVDVNFCCSVFPWCLLWADAINWCKSTVDLFVACLIFIVASRYHTLPYILKPIIVTKINIIN